MPPRSLPEEFKFEAKEFAWSEIRRFVSAVEARFVGVEGEASTFEDEVKKFEALGLNAVNDAIAPLVTQAIDRLTSIGEIFEATSPTEHTISLGAKEFLIPGEERLTFVATSFLAIYANGIEPPAGMLAKLVTFDPVTGLLRVEVTQVDGAGTYDDWNVRVSAPTTAFTGASVAYVDSEITDHAAAELAARAAAVTAAINSLRTELKGSPPVALNTLQKLATALGNDAAFATSITNALNTKVGANSPAFTGTPTAPTAGGGVSTSQIATTAMVQAALNAFGTKEPYNHGNIAAGATLSVNPALGPIQVARKTGAMTVAAPTVNGFVMLFVLNGVGSGSMSFTGFEKVLSGGDAFDTALDKRHLIQIQSVVVTNWNWQTYQIKSLSS